jgi:hypothetical protein
LAAEPAGTITFRSVPLKKDSISKFALSVSTSASMSPRLTEAPSVNFQVRILPELIVSLSWGILISVAIWDTLSKKVKRALNGRSNSAEV